MYSLEHFVNLSRRACRSTHLLPSFLAILLVLGAVSGKPPPSTSLADSAAPSYPQPDLQPPPADYTSFYEGKSFGPMGPKSEAAVVPVITGAAARVVDDAVVVVTTTAGGEQKQQPPPVVKSEGEEGRHGGVEVFQVSFSRVETPFIIGLWIFCASLAKIGFHMAPKLNKIFPESCLLVVVGVVIGIVLIHVTDSMHLTPLTPDTFFFYMLPPIILDAGYFMPNRLFFDHLGTILLFAVIGTIFNTLTIGASLWAVGSTGLFGIETPMLDMFLFSSLISAVDPVAVLAVFEEIQVNEILYIVVFGESLLNDAVTVVLYHMFEGYSEMGLENIVYTDILKGFASFFVVAIGGTVIGVLWGFATGLVTRFTNEVRVIEPIFIFVMAYLAYLNAEIFHMSGILAITFCGITMKNYVEANISHKSHTTIKYAMKMLSSSSETIIFMFLGVSTINSNHNWNTWFVLLTILFCSVFRIIGVIVLTAIANKFRIHQLSKVEKFVMSYGGLRGAVAFALVLLINPKIVPLQPMFVTTTIAVIYFTVFIQGITIKPLVRILKVKTADKRKPTMNERIHERLMDHAMAAIEDILGQHGNYHVRDRFKRFDNKFIRPYLLRDHHGAEPKILETYSKLAMRDAMDYMRRNASTIGNISGTESMSAIFRNYTAANLNGSASFSHLDTSTWNIDMQELEYNPSKKDLTDARIHHLLAEELVKPYKRHRRLSYSRHAVNDRDLSTQVNYKMHFNIRRLVADKKHHKRHSKKMNKEGKQNHVSFPEFQQNGSAKQFSHDYIREVLNEEDSDPKSNKEDWDSPITFTAKSSPSEEGPLSTATEEETSGQLTPLMGLKFKKTTAVEGILPWRRDRSPQDGTEESIFSDNTKRLSKGSIDGVEIIRVSTPTATEAVLPWKREDSDVSSALQQNEFPAWASNKEYLAYNSPSATFLGGIENPRCSVIGHFRRESNSSTGAASNCDSSSSPMKERRGSTTIEEASPPPVGTATDTTQPHPATAAALILNRRSTPVDQALSPAAAAGRRRGSLGCRPSVNSNTTQSTKPGGGGGGTTTSAQQQYDPNAITIAPPPSAATGSSSSAAGAISKIRRPTSWFPQLLRHSSPAAGSSSAQQQQRPTSQPAGARRQPSMGETLMTQRGLMSPDNDDDDEEEEEDDRMRLGGRLGGNIRRGMGGNGGGAGGGEGRDDESLSLMKKRGAF